MALSRVRTLREFRSIGIDKAKIKTLIDEGPPEGMLTNFMKFFEEKRDYTDAAGQAALEELGWLSDADA